MTQHIYEASRAQQNLNSYDSIMIFRHTKQSYSFLLFSLAIQKHWEQQRENVLLRCCKINKLLSKIIYVQNSNIDYNYLLSIDFNLCVVKIEDVFQDIIKGGHQQISWHFSATVKRVCLNHQEFQFVICFSPVLQRASLV